jgi:site-specific recombinase XerC
VLRNATVERSNATSRNTSKTPRKGIRLAELTGTRYYPDDPYRSDVDLDAREIRVRGKGGKPRTVKISHEAARRLDRYLRVRSRHELAYRPQLWLGVNNRGPLSTSGIYQMVVRPGEECGVNARPHRYLMQHHSPEGVNTRYLRRSVRLCGVLSAMERGAAPLTWDVNSRLHQA